MRKPYTLDMSIYRDVDRCAAVENILADLDITPSDRDLEQMADYIICGKDDDDLNLFQKGCDSVVMIWVEQFDFLFTLFHYSEKQDFCQSNF